MRKGIGVTVTQGFVNLIRAMGCEPHCHACGATFEIGQLLVPSRAKVTRAGEAVTKSFLVHEACESLPLDQLPTEEQKAATDRYLKEGVPSATKTGGCFLTLNDLE